MKPTRIVGAAAAFAAAVSFAGPAIGAEAATRYRPVDGSTVLLELPAGSPRATSATDAASAVRQAEAYLRLARATNDARYFGRAEAAIRPWDSGTRVPPGIDLLAADLAQQRHEFSIARQRLDRILANDSRNVEAWIKRANVGLLMGDAASARRDCIGALQAGAALPGTVCLATAMTGPASLERARRLLAALPLDGTTADLARWRLLTEADLALRAGDEPAALGLLEKAHALDPAHEETRTKLAELLLERASFARAQALARAPGPSLARQLVALRAAEALRDAQAPALRAGLEAAFALARRRGETPHDREEAGFALHVDHDAARSLVLAQRNFARQKDTADLRLLAEAARAASSASALESLRAWMRTTGFQDRVVDSKLREAGA